jgi:DNA-binding response OmpR family regulator
MPDMKQLTRSRTIGVFDSHPDTAELLRLLFEADGFRVITVDLREVRSGHLDVADLRERYRFDVIVFDVALPYQANWQLFRDLQARELADVPVVLTTTNERALDALLGEERPQVIEIWGKPYDTERLRSRVHAVLNLPDRRTRSEDRRRGPRTSSHDRRESERRRLALSAGRRAYRDAQSTGASEEVSGTTKRFTRSSS